MMNKMISMTICLLISPCLFAGVVMDMVTSNSASQETDRSKISALGEKLRMDNDSGGNKSSIIFLGDKALILDHQEKTVFTMDEAMLEEMSSTFNAAMKQMEQQLAGMPPEQRAMVEKMMKGQMGAMMPNNEPPPPPPRVVQTGSSSWKSFDCTQYDVYEANEKTREICAADLDDVDGGEEMMQAFRGMGKFMSKLTESLPMRSNKSFNPGELMDQIDGFPVHNVEYDNGQITRTTSMESVNEQDVDEDLFEAPADYRRQDPFQGR